MGAQCSTGDDPTDAVSAAAETIAAAGFAVTRASVERTGRYRGLTLDTAYMNRLVGNRSVRLSEC
ncbi:MAG: hypothetical protein OXM87_04070 [Truepera sp.]|nr:hypothetical protein [Truepera sp.]